MTPDTHETISNSACHHFGEILWHLLKAAQLMKARCLVRVDGYEKTDFGNEVGRDEIHWWIFSREEDLDRFRIRSESALEAAEMLKKQATKLRGIQPKSYPALLATLRGFAEAQQSSSEQILEYINWLHERDPLAPSILFTYRVWGTTQRHNRWIVVNGDTPQEEAPEIRQSLTETALGLRMAQGNLYTFDYVLIESADESSYHGNDYADSGDGNGDKHAEELPEAELAARTSLRVVSEFIGFAEEIRNSLRNILLDIEKCTSQRSVMHSDAFWRKFIAVSTQPARLERQLWDFKETLNVWHTRGVAKEKAKVTFAEDVAALANADGGVLIVGVTNDRKIVGIDSVGDLESRLKSARDTLFERIVYPRELFVFHQVAVQDMAGATKLCLLVIVARAMEPVGVSDSDGRYSYPIRRETGISRPSRNDILAAKIHFKSDSYDFMRILEQFTREN